MNRLVNGGTMLHEEDVARLLDREAVVAVKLAFARAADAGDAHAMVASFAADAVAVYEPARPIAGRGSIRDWYAGALGPVVASSHQLTNFEVDFPSASEAVLRCYLYSWQRFDPATGRADRHRWARYVDTFRRTTEGWLLTSLRLLTAGETPDVPGDRVGEYRSQGY
jgi:ketosteroid isomerase-like protein